MEQSIRLSLVFPRSGQQLWVNVPRGLAQSTENPGVEAYVPREEKPELRRYEPVNENHR